MSTFSTLIHFCFVITAIPSVTFACTCTKEYVPVCGTDGKTYTNKCYVWCYAHVEVAYEGACKAIDSSSSSSSEEGICACALILMPVCGRDGQDYDNKCLAQCAGTSVAYPGKCRLKTIARHLPPLPRTCDECHDDFYPVCAEDNKTYKNRCFAECKKLKVISEGVCYGLPTSFRRVVSGRNWPPPPHPCDDCGDEYNPVCGTDGRNYKNPCKCKCRRGIEVAYYGRCRVIGVDPIRPRIIGSAPNRMCTCPKSYIPVCGFNRVTYANACIAKCAGTGVFYKGVCDPDLKG